jgi:hypothetical protein
MIREKIEEVEIQYLYFKDFKWLSALDSERFAGHPRPNTVYRAIVNSSTNNTKVIITESPDWNAVIINDFNAGEHYTSDCISLNHKNILDANLPEIELDKIIKWQSQDNKDLKRLYKPNIPSPPVLMNLAQAISEQERQEQADLGRAVNILAELRMLDQLGFDIVVDLIRILTKEEPDALAINPNLSTGINFKRIHDSLLRYIGEDRRTNYDRNDLIETFLAIMNELKSLEQ